MEQRPLSKGDLEDLLCGAEILSTGGGGTRQWAQILHYLVEEADKTITLVSAREVQPEGVVVSVVLVGGGVDQQQRDRFVSRHGKLPSLPEYQDCLESICEGVSQLTTRKIVAVLPFEIGCGNTMLAAYVAAMLEKPLIDGDCCGRAVPELPLCTLNLQGIPFTPLLVVTPAGERILLEGGTDYERIEEICRSLANLSAGTCFVASASLKAARLPKSVVLGSLSRCQQLGVEIRSARQRSDDPVETAVRFLQGHLLFEGTVFDSRRAEREGFLTGEHHIKGVDRWGQSELRVHFKNENLVCFLNEKPWICGPDLICILDRSTGKGLSNWGDGIRQGRQVSVVGVPADPVWRSSAGATVFNPVRFGYKFEYRPIEELLRS